MAEIQLTVFPKEEEAKTIGLEDGGLNVVHEKEAIPIPIPSMYRRRKERDGRKVRRFYIPMLKFYCRLLHYNIHQ